MPERLSFDNPHRRANESLRTKVLFVRLPSGSSWFVTVWNLEASRIWFCANDLSNCHGFASSAGIAMFDDQVNTQII